MPFPFWVLNDILPRYLNVADLILLRFTSKGFEILKTKIDELASHYPHRNNYDFSEYKTDFHVIGGNKVWNWVSLFAFFGYYYAIENIDSQKMTDLLSLISKPFQKRKNNPFSERDRQQFLNSQSQIPNLSINLRATFTMTFITISSNSKWSDGFHSFFEAATANKLLWKSYYSTNDIISYIIRLRSVSLVAKGIILLLQYDDDFEQVKSLLQLFPVDKLNLDKVFYTRYHKLYNVWKVFNFFASLNIKNGFIGSDNFKTSLLESEYYNQFYSLDNISFIKDSSSFFLGKTEFQNYLSKRQPSDITFSNCEALFSDWKNTKLNSTVQSSFDIDWEFVTSGFNSNLEVPIESLFKYATTFSSGKKFESFISYFWDAVFVHDHLTLDMFASITITQQWEHVKFWYFPISFIIKGNYNGIKITKENGPIISKNIKIILEAYRREFKLDCLCKIFFGNHEYLHICELFNTNFI